MDGKGDWSEYTFGEKDNNVTISDYNLQIAKPYFFPIL
jgi:uncharacterized protein YaiE (UPF0345 family)